MKLACLYSGGKDSTYAIYDSIMSGHDVKCLLTLFPSCDESLLFHYPNARITPFIANAMGIPQLVSSVNGTDLSLEVKALNELIRKAKAEYDVDGIVHGGISSEFQSAHFSRCCLQCDINVLSPLWGKPAVKFMKDIISNGFKTLITSVSAMGLDKNWLGQIIDDDLLEKLIRLSNRNRFNLNFEGGEAETLVLDSPIHKRIVNILGSKVRWDGQRGMLKITRVALRPK